MRKENLNLFLLMLGAGIIVVLAYLLMQPEKDVKSETPPTPLKTITSEPTDTAGGFNPNYGNLTESQIKIADMAIGKLLNNSQGITPPMITVKSFEAKDFSNAALGCPQSGMMYAEVITPGYQVVLEAQGKEYDYRLTDENNIILCEQ